MAISLALVGCGQKEQKEVQPKDPIDPCDQLLPTNTAMKLAMGEPGADDDYSSLPQRIKDCRRKQKENQAGGAARRGQAQGYVNKVATVVLNSANCGRGDQICQIDLQTAKVLEYVKDRNKDRLRSLLSGDLAPEIGLSRGLRVTKPIPHEGSYRELKFRKTRPTGFTFSVQNKNIAGPNHWSVHIKEWAPAKLRVTLVIRRLSGDEIPSAGVQNKPSAAATKFGARFKVTPGKHDLGDYNASRACFDSFGRGWHPVHWSHLMKHKDRIHEIIDGAQLGSRHNDVSVLFKGNRRHSGSFHQTQYYTVRRCTKPKSGHGPVHAKIGDHLIELGTSTGDRPLFCVKYKSKRKRRRSINGFVGLFGVRSRPSARH